jgi:hypothetical protein
MTTLLPNWTGALSLQAQAVLVMALRGPDGFPKFHKSKDVLRRYRACLLRNAATGLYAGRGRERRRLPLDEL